MRDKSLKLIAALLVGWAPLSQAAPYPITVRGADEGSFGTTLASKVQNDKSSYDVIVVGAGLAGLSASLYLTDQKKRVLLLEKESEVGGLALGGTSNGTPYDRGAAYWTNAFDEEQKILEHIGIGDFEKRFAIPEPSDSYFWNGKLYEGIWEDETLKKLPASFALFHQELKLESPEIPNQPLEESTDMSLDDLSAAAYIRSMPERIARRTDPESKAVYERFLADKTLDKKDPMGAVVGLMDLYCRSALGTTAEGVSALAYANFYAAEIETRYTTPIGTGKAAVLMETTLKQNPGLFVLKTEATVVRVIDHTKSVEVLFNQGKQTWRAKGKYVVFAAQLKLAPKIIEGFREKAKERAALIDEMAYANYSVHNVFVQGHPYRATYDTWTRALDYSDDDFTDVILGRWMDPEIKGYEGMRDFSKNPQDDNGILTIYHPLTPKWVGSGYTKDQASALAEKAVDRMLELYNPLLKANWGTSIQVKSVETSRWPISVHVPRPGHFRIVAKAVRKPFGHIFFANNNMGTPAFEEALFRGHCAANNVLSKLEKTFQQESWSRCPLERE